MLLEEHYNNSLLRNREYVNDNGFLHNPNGPASEIWYKNGQLKKQAYVINGLLHNPNGPAIQIWTKESNLTRCEYWFNNIQYPSLEKLQYAVKMSCLK